jgi:hypothetical protein
VEQPGPARRGTICASWNNFVEQFRRRGTIFFQKKRFDFVFFAVKLRAVSWNNSRTVEQFGVPSAFSW